MVNVITSWTTFNCIREKGPPFPMNPKRLAGTWAQYSNKAISTKTGLPRREASCQSISFLVISNGHTRQKSWTRLKRSIIISHKVLAYCIYLSIYNLSENATKIQIPKEIHGMEHKYYIARQFFHHSFHKETNSTLYWNIYK